MLFIKSLNPRLVVALELSGWTTFSIFVWWTKNVSSISTKTISEIFTIA